MVKNFIKLCTNEKRILSFQSGVHEEYSLLDSDTLFLLEVYKRFEGTYYLHLQGEMES
jgi:hypothetical protein